jgi:superfamily I DNA and/or RNA helicase
MASRIEASELGRAAPPHIARRLEALCAGSGLEGKREVRDLARLVSRAANVVLATTTSRELSDLLATGKRFDWSIVEEAGKAHGFDLAIPMLASHRILMVGDHEQLPAFNEAAYRKLLAEPERVREALTRGAAFIPRRLGFDLGPMESDEAMQAFEARCTRWLPMVRTFGHVFEESNSLPPGSIPIAVRLNEQHRMHPEICDLVRACFYHDLKTADAAREKLTRPDPFAVVEGSWLPSERLVFVNMPWIQTSLGAKGQDVDRHGRMMLRSAAEADAVAEVLAQLLPIGKCDLQVLTPYNAQVPLIRKALARARAGGKLPHLDLFAKPKGKDEFGATIDGFQGEEADVVVVSLVKNNDKPPPGGVGFLSERPRLNVMLSRARRKLVLVGCWEFFIKRAGDDAWKDCAHPLHDLATVFHEFGEAVHHGTACRIDLPRATP